MNDKSICMVVPSLSSGGAERVVSILTSTLAEQGKKIFLIVHRHAKLEYPVSGKVNVLYLDDCKCSPVKAVAKIQRLIAVRRYLKKNKIDYVIPFLDSCMKHTFIASRGLKCAFISTLRNNPYERTHKESRDCDLIAGRAEGNFVQNEEQKNYFNEKIRKKTFIVPNPVSSIFLAGEKQYSDSIRKMVAIGRLNEQKNYKRLLTAIGTVRKKYSDIHLKIYGEGNLDSEIRSMIKASGLEDTVELMGRTNDVMGVLSENDLFVMSSDYEGMPNALMEAMAFGMPCVSTDCPTGPRALIGNDERGMLAELDDGASLSDKIIDMIEHADSAKIKGQRAKEYMKAHFSDEVIAKEFYEKCTECH